MKLSSKQLRKLINEGYLRDIPEFLIRAEVKKMVSSLSDLVRRNVLSTIDNQSDRDTALSVSNSVLTELEEEVNELVEQKIWKILELS